MRRLVAQIFSSLRKAGRGVATECAICTDPLDPTDSDDAIDVLECLHAFHTRCVRTHMLDRWEGSVAARQGENWAIEDIACPECREPIMLYGRDLELRGIAGDTSRLAQPGVRATPIYSPRREG